MGSSLLDRRNTKALGAILYAAVFIIAAAKATPIPRVSQVSSPVRSPGSTRPQPHPLVGDDLYTFQGATTHPLRLESDSNGMVSFAWPSGPGSWDTALLQVSVGPAAISAPDSSPPRWVDMSVSSPCAWAPPLDYGRQLDTDTISPGRPAPAGCVRQFVEPEASGIRYLNLSFLHATGVSDGQQVQLKTHDVALQPQATLWLFHTHLPAHARVLVLAPHPDDAEIAAFGIYAQQDAWVITVTAGDAGGFAYRAEFAAPDYAFKGRLRVIDSVTVPLQGGVPPAHCFNLGYFDARVDAMYTHPDMPVREMYVDNDDTLPYRRLNPGRLLPIQRRTATWNHLVADLRKVVNTLQPDVIVAPHPFLDAHRDHEFVSVALAEALRHVRLRHAPQLLLYTNHAVPDERYPYGPTGTVAGLPPSGRAGVPFQGVYSLPLAPMMQTRKLFALEAMHDLRAEPAAEYAFPTPTGAARHLNPTPEPAVDENYFRRAVHANEIYLTYDAAGFQQLVARFLAIASPPAHP